MLLLCRFEKNGVCRRCGRENKSGVAALKANCRAVCVHAGDAVPDILTRCKSCKGNVLIKQEARVCDLYGRCLPGFEPHGDELADWVERKPESDIYRLCRSCPEFEPLLPAPPAV